MQKGHRHLKTDLEGKSDEETSKIFFFKSQTFHS